MYSYGAEIPVLKNMVLRSKWVFKLDGNVSRYNKFLSLIPEIKFFYVYPIQPK